MSNFNHLCSMILLELNSGNRSIRGEFWLNDGNAIFADGDIGDDNHATIILRDLRSEAEEILGVDEYDIDDGLSEEQIAELDGKMDIDAIKLLAFGNPAHEDVLKYAMGHLGWARMAGNSIETATLDSSSMRNIANGIAEASMMEEDELAEQVFDIEVTGSGNWFRDVPFAVLDGGDVAALAPYRIRSFGESSEE